jgi:hypothetical protein
VAGLNGWRSKCYNINKISIEEIVMAKYVGESSMKANGINNETIMKANGRNINQ